RRYLLLLFKEGMATCSGKVNHARLKSRFLDHYSPALLERLGCGLELRYHWLSRFVSGWSRTRHPLHHLLVMQFLESPAEEFFRLPIEVKPFGKGPWPCLNTAGGHYMEARIAE